MTETIQKQTSQDINEHNQKASSISYTTILPKPHQPRLPPKTKITSAVTTDDSEWLVCSVPGCSFWTRKPERMERHNSCHVSRYSKHFKCPDCGKKIFSLPKMLKHDRLNHTGVKDYECRLCGAEVTDIAIHMRVS